MSCQEGYTQIGEYCVKLPKISPWGDEPFEIRVIKVGYDKGVEISVKMDMKGEKLVFSAKPYSVGHKKD